MKNSYYHLMFEGSNIFELILTVAAPSQRFSTFTKKKATHTHKHQTHLLMWRIQLINLKFLTAGDSKVAKQRFAKNIINYLCRNVLRKRRNGELSPFYSLSVIRSEDFIAFQNQSFVNFTFCLFCRLITGSPSSKYEHRRASTLLHNIQNIRICMGKKPIVSVTYENERISIKKTVYLT